MRRVKSVASSYIGFGLVRCVSFLSLGSGGRGRERILFDLSEVAGSYLQWAQLRVNKIARKLRVQWSPQTWQDGVTHYSNHLIQHCGGLQCGDIEEGE